MYARGMPASCREAPQSALARRTARLSPRCEARNVRALTIFDGATTQL